MIPQIQPLLWKGASTAVACDPYFSNVVLLMGYEGSANGTFVAPAITDESPAAHGNATRVGGAVTDTTHFKFGSASLDNSSSQTQFADSNDWNFGTGRFTIECWFYASSTTGVCPLVDQWGSAPNMAWNLAVYNGNLIWQVSTTGSDFPIDITDPGTVSINTWYHAAIDYDGTKYRLYRNGVMVGSSSTARTLLNSTYSLTIGGDGQSHYFGGWIDELRITKGIARYASDGATVTTWNSSDNVGTTLSNGNLTTAAVGSSAQGVRAAVSHTSGKYYYEITTGATYANTAGMATGICIASTSLSTVTPLNAFAVYPASGQINYNNTSTGDSIGAYATNAVIGVAIDLTNFRGWFRQGTGNWNGVGGADPAANTGGVDLSAVFGSNAAFPFEGFFAANGSNVTANFGSTAFVNGPPSGFLPWNGAAFAVPTAAFPRVACALGWDAATVSNVTLSNSNLTATNTGTTSADQGAHVIASSGKSTGKYYFEITAGYANGANAGLGLGTTSSTYTAMGNNATTGAMVYAGTGNIYANGSFTGKALGIGFTSDKIGIAVDLTAHLIWFKDVTTAGNWNATAGADPATGTGGITIPSGTYVPFCTFGGGSSLAGNSFTANFTGAFAGAVPSGFTSGWPP